MASPFDVERSLGFLVYDISRLLQRTFDRRARSLGLTQVQWRALVHLSRNEGINQVTLAEILGVQPITLARLIDRMERDDWVERRSHPTDRRAVCLFLTAKAAPLMAELLQRGRSTLEEAIRGISKEAREATIDVLIGMKRNLLAAERSTDKKPATILERRRRNGDARTRA